MSSTIGSIRQEIHGRYISHNVLKEYLASKFPGRYTIELVDGYYTVHIPNMLPQSVIFELQARTQNVS
ncbi:hypothetical protein BDD12DRAFT_891552 [Trichophaea hybrida]|nr:hypothetical protein BDD12DRAFT_891552 [Trichophaea hybrida]